MARKIQFFTAEICGEEDLLCLLGSMLSRWQAEIQIKGQLDSSGGIPVFVRAIRASSKTLSGREVKVDGSESSYSGERKTKVIVTFDAGSKASEEYSREILSLVYDAGGRSAKILFEDNPSLMYEETSLDEGFFGRPESAEIPQE